MILKYLIDIFLGWICSSIAIIVLIILRVGIPLCNNLIKNNEEIEAVKLLRNKYYISLVLWLSIIVIITFLSYHFLNEGFYGYAIAWAVMILIGFNSTGKTENNIDDFNKSLLNNIDIVKNKSK